MTLVLLGALLVGLTLGLLGSGGSILTVPVLVYVLGHDDKAAIAESLAIVGTIALIGMLAKNKISGDRAETVEMVGLYWHFVDVVWILIFTLVYLIPA